MATTKRKNLWRPFVLDPYVGLGWWATGHAGLHHKILIGPFHSEGIALVVAYFAFKPCDRMSLEYFQLRQGVEAYDAREYEVVSTYPKEYFPDWRKVSFIAPHRMVWAHYAASSCRDWVEHRIGVAFDDLFITEVLARVGLDPTRLEDAVAPWTDASKHHWYGRLMAAISSIAEEVRA